MQIHHKVLILEDDIRLRSLLERYLIEQGFQIRTATNSEQMNRILMRESIDLIILDLILPGEDGLSICKQLKRQNNHNDIPIIIITAKTEEVDRIVGLEIGADDYISKPFNPRELLARIRVILRRKVNKIHDILNRDNELIYFGTFKLNLRTREIFQDKQLIHITNGEFAILKVLVSHPNQPLSRDKLMNFSRGREYNSMERSIDIQISRLRRIIEQNQNHPRYIQTIWGLGYIFIPDGKIS